MRETICGSQTHRKGLGSQRWILTYYLLDEPLYISNFKSYYILNSSFSSLLKRTSKR